MPLVNKSSELANKAIKNLNGRTDKAIRKAVLMACPEMPELVTQAEIDEAVARIKRGVSVADKLKEIENRVTDIEIRLSEMR
jgi:hypothetical protein